MIPLSYNCVHVCTYAVYTWDCTTFLLRNDSAASQTFSWEQLFWTFIWHQLFSCCYQAGKPQFLHILHTDMLKINFKLHKRVPSKTIRTWATNKTIRDFSKEPGGFFQLTLELPLSVPSHGRFTELLVASSHRASSGLDWALRNHTGKTFPKFLKYF